MQDTFVKSFTHLKARPKADQALHLLQRTASLVKPIMRKHGWVLPVLAEFFPDNPSLLGLNINGGQKILVRLRPAHAPDTFLDEESVVGTMLHELAHNVHGPHDEKFYQYLKGLEEEYNTLKRTGYAGEGFFSKGHRLGASVSHNLPPYLARQKALEAAEKRRQVNAVLGRGGRLGGPGGTIRGAKSPRELAAEAAERRARDEKTCASGQLAREEAEKAAKESVESKVIDLTIDSDSEPEIVTVDLTPTGPGRASQSSSGKSSPVTFQPIATKRNGKNLRPQSSTAPSVRPPDDNLRKHSVAEPWSCPQCTLINDPTCHRCTACDLVRPRDTSVEDAWSCNVCGEADIPSEFWSCRFCGSIKDRS